MLSTLFSYQIRNTAATGKKINFIPATATPYSVPHTSCSGPTLSNKSPLFLVFETQTYRSLRLWASPRKHPLGLFSPQHWAPSVQQPLWAMQHPELVAGLSGAAHAHGLGAEGVPRARCWVPAAEARAHSSTAALCSVSSTFSLR